MTNQNNKGFNEHLRQNYSLQQYQSLNITFQCNLKGKADQDSCRAQVRCTPSKGGNVTSAGWQVTLCYLIWHMSSHRGEGLVHTATLFTFTGPLSKQVNKQFKSGMHGPLSFSVMPDLQLSSQPQGTTAR